MILGVSSCSEGDLDERLIGTWESESGFMIIKKDRTMKMLGKVDRKVVQGPISTEGGLLFLLTPFTGETITFFEYEIIDFEHVRIDRALFNRRGGPRPKEGAVGIPAKPLLQ